MQVWFTASESVTIKHPSLEQRELGKWAPKLMQQGIWKTQHSFMIKSFRKLGIEGIFLNIINIVHEKPVLILYPAAKDQKLHPWD